MSSTKTKRNLAVLMLLLALRPNDAAAYSSVSLTGGASTACNGVRGDGPCERFARGALSLDFFHFKKRSLSTVEEGTVQVRDAVVDFGAETIARSPEYGASAVKQDIRSFAIVPFSILVIALFGAFLIFASYLMAAVFLGLALAFGAEATLGLYVVEEGSRAPDSNLVLRHYGAQASIYPVDGAWFKAGFGVGLLQALPEDRTGHSFKANMGIAPPPERSGPVVLAEVERLRLPESPELEKTESRQVALTAGFSLSF